MSSITSEQNTGSSPRPHRVIDVMGDDGYRIQTFVFLANGQQLVAGYYDGTMKVLDLQSGEQVGREMKNEGYGKLCVTEDGTKIVSASRRTLPSFHTHPLSQPASAHPCLFCTLPPSTSK